MTATVQKLTKSFSQTKRDRFVAQQVKSMKRSRAKGHRDWIGTTDQQIDSIAQSMARMYDAGTVWS